jgi:hypothetical protein
VTTSELIRFNFCLDRAIPYLGSVKVARQSLPVKYEGMYQFLLNESSKWIERRPYQLLEVGSWVGGSALVWLNALKESGRIDSALLSCMDPWAPYFDPTEMPDSASYYGGHPEMHSALVDGSGFSLFVHNISAAGYSPYVRVVRELSHKGLENLPQNTFDFVYLDGNHAYDAIKGDIERAKRLVRPGGILCGDDLDIQFDDVPDPKQCFAQRNQDCTTGPLSYHAGVTLAVHEEFGRVQPALTFWAVRREGSGWVPIDVAALVVGASNCLPFYFYNEQDWPDEMQVELRAYVSKCSES